MDASTPVNGSRGPQLNDYSICIDCTGLSQFALSGPSTNNDQPSTLVKADESTAPAEIQDILNRARSYLRENPRKRF